MSLAAIVLMVRMGAKRVASERVALVGQLVVYWVLILSYGVLFQGVDPARLARHGLIRAQLIWYLVVTQSVIACTYFHYRELEQDIRSGAIETMLLRPVDFWPLKLAEWFGQYVTRLFIAIPFGFLIAHFVSLDATPDYAKLCLFTMPCLAAGGLIFLCLHMVVGCSAIWFDPAESVYRVWQKMLFFLGARSTPLLLYPLWLRGLAWATPFPAVFAVPASLAISSPGSMRWPMILFQMAWLCAALLAAAWMARRVRGHIGAHG